MERKGGARRVAAGAGHQHRKSVSPFAIVVPGRGRPIEDTVAMVAPARCQPLIFSSFDLVAGETVQIVAKTFLIDQPCKESEERRDGWAKIECEETRDSPVNVGTVPCRNRP